MANINIFSIEDAAFLAREKRISVFFCFLFLVSGSFLAETAALLSGLLLLLLLLFFFFFFSSTMNDGYDAASCALRWDCKRGGRAADLLRLLLEHASALRQLHVELEARFLLCTLE